MRLHQAEKVCPTDGHLELDGVRDCLEWRNLHLSQLSSLQENDDHQKSS